MVEAIALLAVASFASISAVVFMDMAMFPPLLEEQFFGLLYQSEVDLKLRGSARGPAGLRGRGQQSPVPARSHDICAD